MDVENFDEKTHIEIQSEITSTYEALEKETGIVKTSLKTALETETGIVKTALDKTPNRAVLKEGNNCIDITVYIDGLQAKINSLKETHVKKRIPYKLPYIISPYELLIEWFELKNAIIEHEIKNISKATPNVQADCIDIFTDLSSKLLDIIEESEKRIHSSMHYSNGGKKQKKRKSTKRRKSTSKKTKRRKSTKKRRSTK
jgi:hypothetical protein